MENTGTPIILYRANRLTIFSHLSGSTDKRLDRIDVAVDGELHPVHTAERIEHLLWSVGRLHLLELLLRLLLLLSLLSCSSGG